MISRNDKKLVWQYINWHNIAKYIDNLKSRIYKAFLYRYLPEIYKQQSVFITSKLVIIWAIKKSIFDSNLIVNTFEIGYCVLCLSNSNFIDLSFFYYYSDNFYTNRISDIQYLIRKIKHLIILSCLEPYYNYLLYLNNLYNIQIYNLNNCNNRFNDQFIHKYSLSFDLSSYIRSISVYVLLDKLHLDVAIKKHLCEFLDLGLFVDLIFYLDVSSISMILYKNCFSLTSKLLDIFMLQLCYEISIMFSYSSLNKSSKSEIIFMNDKFSFIVLSKDNKEIKRIRKKLLSLVLFHGISIIKKPEEHIISLLNGININLWSISTNYQVYPFDLIIRPSLYSQFILMKHLSAILIQSISKPLVLLVIRFNMLLLLWSINYTGQPIHRILYLIDYLITLKLRLFINKKKLNLYISTLRISIKYELFMNYNYTYMSKVINQFIFISLNNCSYYNHYIVVKLFWLYKLKCNISLREAV